MYTAMEKDSFSQFMADSAMIIKNHVFIVEFMKGNLKNASTCELQVAGN